MQKLKKAIFSLLFFLISNQIHAIQPFKLGISAAFTGSSGQLGSKLVEGSSLYFDNLNKHGGIHGQQIQLKSYDDQYDPLRTVYNTVKLIQTDQINLLFDYVGTPTTTRILPLLKQYEGNNTLLFFPFSGAMTLREQPYLSSIFNFRASYQEETKALVDFFFSQKKTKIAILYQADAFGRSGWDGVRKALAQKGLTLVGEATYKRGCGFKESMDSQVRILKKENPDAIIIIGSYNASGAFIRDARESHWDIPMASVSFVGVENLVDLLNTYSHSHRITFKDIYISQVIPHFTDTSIRASQEYVSAAQKAKKIPNYLGFEGYLNAKLLSLLLLKTTPPLSTEKLKKLLETPQTIDLGLDATVTIGGTEHQASHSVYLTQIQNGHILKVEKELKCPN